MKTLRIICRVMHLLIRVYFPSRKMAKIMVDIITIEQIIGRAKVKVL